jgi:hypothetical protein
LLNADPVVDRTSIDLYRNVSQQKLNLLQFFASSVVQARARAAKIMRCNPAQPQLGSIHPDKINTSFGVTFASRAVPPELHMFSAKLEHRATVKEAIALAEPLPQ